jgi:hypothetical protein
METGTEKNCVGMDRDGNGLSGDGMEMGMKLSRMDGDGYKL